MRRHAISLTTVLALAITLYLLWSKLRIVVWVHLPWWGLLIILILVYLVVEYLVELVLGRRRGRR